MSHPQSHRGPAPKDERLFGARQLPALQAATADLCWLLDRGYALRSSVQLVGNRHSLTGRQRMAVARCACSEAAAQRRRDHCVDPRDLRGQELWIDGYNVLTVLESALAGGVVLLGKDGCYRDIAGIHRRYRKVEETTPVLRLIAEAAAEWGTAHCRWLLDRPVSNSGRLKALIVEVAQETDWDTEVKLVYNPDHVLSQTENVVATSDSMILDRCERWVNLARLLIARYIPGTRLVDLELANRRTTVKHNDP